MACTSIRSITAPGKCDPVSQLSSYLRFCTVSPAHHPANTLSEQIAMAKALKFSTLPNAYSTSLGLASPLRFNPEEAPLKLTQVLQQEESVLSVVRQLEHLRNRALDPLALASSLPSHKVMTSKSSSLDWLDLETRRSCDLHLTSPKLTGEQSKLINPQSQLEFRLAAEPTLTQVSRFEKALDWLKTPLKMLTSLTPAHAKAKVALPRRTQLLMNDSYRGSSLVKADALGKGIYGSIRTAFHGETEYALKEPNGRVKDAQRFCAREVCAYMAFNHPSIVSLEGVSSDGLLLEKIRGGSLADRLATKTPLDPHQLKTYLTDIAAALVAVHDSGKTYKDLKPANILLDRNHAKLCDFGLTVNTEDDQEYSGSPLFQAPEINLFMRRQAMSQKPIESFITQAADSWSFGVLLYTILTGGYYVFYNDKKETGQQYAFRISRTLYGKPCNEKELFAPLTPEHQERLRNYDPTGVLKRIVVDCLHGDPAKRISMHEVQKLLVAYIPPQPPSRFSVSSALCASLRRLHDALAAFKIKI